MRSFALFACLLLAACAATSGNKQPQQTTGTLRVAMVVDVDQRPPLAPPGYATPAVVGGKIVIGARDRRARILTMDGSELARIALEAPSESGALAVTDTLVVLGDVRGMLYGIDVQAGRITWRKQLSSVLLGRPVPLGDDFLVQTLDNRVYRFGPDGSKRWSYGGQYGGGLSLHQSASPVVHGDAVYAVFSNGDVVKLKQASGDLIWRRQLLLDASAKVLSELRVPLADPVIAGDALIVSFYQGDTVALATSDGRLLWQRPISLRSAPAVVGDRLYAADSKGSVLLLDAASGDTLWRNRISEGELVGPVLWRDRLVVADDRGMVYVLNKAGRIVAKKRLAGRFDRPPVVAGDSILVRNDLGSLYRLQ